MWGKETDLAATFRFFLLLVALLAFFLSGVTLLVDQVQSCDRGGCNGGSS